MKQRLTTFCTQITFSTCHTKRLSLVDHSKVTNKERGVELHCELDTLTGLEIDNSLAELTITAAIFDDHCFKNDVGEDIEHCEAVLFPEPYSDQNWMLFTELKYAKNLGGDLKKAFEQVKNTILLFREKHLMEASKVVNAVISFPISNRRPPYENFLFSNDREALKNYKKVDKFTINGVNKITILSTQKIKC